MQVEHTKILESHSHLTSVPRAVKSNIFHCTLSNGETYDFKFMVNKFGPLLNRGLSVVSGEIDGKPLSPDAEAVFILVNMEQDLSNGRKMYRIKCCVKKELTQEVNLFRCSGQLIKKYEEPLQPDWVDFALRVG